MAQQQPSTLRFAPVGAPSDAADGGARFVLVGDATAAPIEAIIPDPGVALPLRPRRCSGHPFRLHLLHLNDLHGHISRLEQPGSPPILSHVAGRVQQLHSHCQDDPLSAVLLLSAGDELAGSIFDDVSANGLLHPVYHLYSRMGLDAAVLGNHDLDLGPARLAEAIRRHARFPGLAANLAPVPELAELVHPAALVERGRMHGLAVDLAVPTVLRLKVYINVPKRNTPRWTRRGVFVRDANRCAYCGRLLKRGELTVDHVFPVSRGGGSTWGNTVTACAPCNQRKADRTPHEAGKRLLIEPKTPRTNYLLAAGDIPASWKLWIEL